MWQRAITVQTVEDYNYDKSGNRTGGGYTTGAANRITSDGTYNYSYDAEGNLTQKTEIANPANYWMYFWDNRNRLTRVEEFPTPSLTVIDYTYDVFDRRISKKVAETGSDRWEFFVYDGPDVILVYDETGSLTTTYLHGPATDQVLAAKIAGETLWYFADHLGTVRDVGRYDLIGFTTGPIYETVIVNHLVYDSFGKIDSQTDDSYEPAYAFTGREWDADAGLYYYRARWYDANVGRFVSEDFIPDDLQNTYRYVGNSPTNATDPSGLAGDPVSDYRRDARRGQIDQLSPDKWDDLVVVYDSTADPFNISGTQWLRLHNPKTGEYYQVEHGSYRIIHHTSPARSRTLNEDVITPQIGLRPTDVSDEHAHTAYEIRRLYATGNTEQARFLSAQACLQMIPAGERGVGTRLYPRYRGKSSGRNQAVPTKPETKRPAIQGPSVAPKAKGSANPATKKAAARGSTLHADKPGHLPDQLRQRYPDTQFEFTTPGVAGQDVKVVGGKHPSNYPGSTWHKGVDRADFKPATPGGKKTFKSDQKNKWTEPTEMLPYDPNTGNLQ